MKTSTLTVFLCFMLMNLSGQDVLNGIEKKILDAYGQSVQSQTNHFQPILKELTQAYEKEPSQIINYWMCFALYREALLLMNADQEEKAFQNLKKGIDRLKNLDQASSEDLALQAAMLSLSINFQPEVAALLSGEAAALYGKAVKLDDNNLRAYLGIGRSDFYKPVEYGGGYQVESYLKQALAKPDQSTQDPHMPSWGRDEAYFYLASYYLREGRKGEAQMYCMQGLKKFPGHSRLTTLKAKLQ